MDRIIEELKEWGCDTEGTLKRFMMDTDLYFHCLHEVLAEPALPGLLKALQEEDTESAFAHAHNLKGVYANLGLTSMYETACALVEPLRGGRLEGCGEAAERLQEEQEHLLRILEE